MSRGAASARAIERDEPSAPLALAYASRLLAERRRPGRTLLFAVPAPVAPVERLLDAAGHEPTVLFAPPDAAHVAGFGVAHAVRLEGTERFDALRRESAAIFERLDVVRTDFPWPGGPRLFGGLAFAVGSSGGEFRGFGDGLFVLPRVTYVVEGTSAVLALAVPAERSDAAVLDDVARAFAALEDARTPARRPVSCLSIDRGDVGAFERSVLAIVDAIRSGAFSKIVAARRAELHLTGRIEPAWLLERLGERFPGCTRFALDTGESVFLGATPERLVTKKGSAVATEALAGSVALGHAKELLASTKDLEEHRLVVDSILDALRPFARDLSAAERPVIRELPNVLHMQTPIEGRLAEGVDVLELVEALHPTPAVGGVPTQEAVRFIVAHEPAPRGLYAGPFGWLDASGDGAFVVALRSALFAGDRAYVYAGAGIVRDSAPGAELAETELKMQAILGALDGEAR
ncbi:MAG: isochorismate synthase [Polyangiales bacterium]